jgi:hypothetical protein
LPVGAFAFPVLGRRSFDLPLPTVLRAPHQLSTQPELRKFAEIWAPRVSRSHDIGDPTGMLYRED